ncbi:MAG: MFS transporter [Streptosporangiales bacterium]
MRDLLRRGDFRLLLLALTLTMFGDRALLLANGIWVKSLTGSNALAGLNILLIAAPSIIAPFFGVVVDKVRRRPFLIALNLSCAAAIVPLLLVEDPGDVWIVYAVSFLYGIALILNDAAVNGVLKVMLAERQLASANGVIQTMREGLRLVAPLAGAGLFAAFGGHSVVLLDIATFVLGAGTLAVLKLRESPPESSEHHFAVEMTAGIRHLFGTSPLRRVVLTCGVALLVVGFTETAFFAVVDQGLHRPPSFLGVLLSLQGVGAIAGGLTAARVVRKLGEQATVALGLVLFALGDALCVFSHLAAVAAGIIVAGAGLPWILVGLYTLVQRSTPNRLLGRVGTATEVVLGAPQTLSIGLGAILITVVDYRLLIGTLAVVVIGCGGFLLLRRSPTPAPEKPVVQPATAESPAQP